MIVNIVIINSSLTKKMHIDTKLTYFLDSPSFFDEDLSFSDDFISESLLSDDSSCFSLAFDSSSSSFSLSSLLSSFL